MKKVLTFGVFDLLHRGHVELFRRAKELGDYLIVAVQDSEDVTKFKPHANLVGTTQERCYMVDAIKYVDQVIVYHNVLDGVKTTDFDVLVTGPDQVHDLFVKAFDYCKSKGKQVVVLPRTEGISSSAIKSSIENSAKE